MWLSEERNRRPAAETAAEWGPVTISEPAAVYLAGERRQVPVCCPGGYTWRPAVGEEVLVLKAGNRAEQPYILGRTGGEAEGLEPGQVRIGSGDCSILWGDKLKLTGTVQVNGEELEALVRRVIAERFGPAAGEGEGA